MVFSPLAMMLGESTSTNLGYSAPVLGDRLGEIDGDRDGDTLGLTLGDLLGLIEGLTDGDLLGLLDGDLLGLLDCDRDAEGLNDAYGDRLGLADGLSDEPPAPAIAKYLNAPKSVSSEEKSRGQFGSETAVPFPIRSLVDFKCTSSVAKFIKPGSVIVVLPLLLLKTALKYVLTYSTLLSVP